MHACMRRCRGKGAGVLSCAELVLSLPGCVALPCRPPFSEVLDRVVQLETELDSLTPEVQASS